MDKKKAIVAGHLCIDITPVFPAGMKKVEHLGMILQPGKLINTLAPDIHAGGAVANTGLGMKALGADVALLGKVGKDEFGSIVGEIMNRYGAGDHLIVDENSATSYTIVIAVPGVDRVFLHCPGSNDSFTFSDIPEAELREAALFHFGYPPIMASMFRDGGKELIRMMRTIRGMGIATSLDMAAVDPSSEAGKADWRQIVRDVLPYVDFFVPSFEEICYMLEPEKYGQLQQKARGADVTTLLDPEEDVKPLARKCLDWGAKAVLLKCGAPGMYLLTSDRMDEVGERLGLDAKKWNHFEAFERSFRIDRVLSGTGAGDTSIAGFLTSILEGCGPKEALENAAAEGALCCTSYDTVSGLKPLPEIRRMIAAGWEKA